MFTKGQLIVIGGTRYEVLICSEIDEQYQALIKLGFTHSLGLKLNGKLFTAFTDGLNFSIPKPL